MKFLHWLWRVIGGPPKDLAKETGSSLPKDFRSCVVVQLPPSNDRIAKGDFFVVASDQHKKWALFKCPCGCGRVITLGLSARRKPHWVVTLGSGKFPTLYPSVRQLDGCLSHFWLKDGTVYWCRDTGKPYDPELESV